MPNTDSGIDRESHHGRVVRLQDRLERVGPDAWPLEHGLDHNRAGEQDAEQQPDLRHCGNQRVAQHVFPYDEAGRDAHRALIDDEIFLQRLQHAGSREAHHRRQRRKRQRERRKGEVGHNIAKPREVAFQKRIDNVEARDRWRREAGDPRLQGKPAEIHREIKLQHQCKPEARHREPRHRDDAQYVVDDRVAVKRRDDAERNPDHHGNDHRDDRQLDGRRQAGIEVVPNRPSREQAGAKIARKQLPIIVDELDQQRPVEPELLAQELDLRARRRLTRELGDRVGWNDARDEEHNCDKTRKRWNSPRDTLKDKRRNPHYVAFTSTASRACPFTPRRTRPLSNRDFG